MKIGVLTVSDSCSKGDAEDGSGKNLGKLIENGIIANGKLELYAIVPDELDVIKATLLEWADVKLLDLILTTGGTGCAPRDVTPEATEALLEKRMPGLTIAMITKSLEITSMAMLSRPACGTRGKTLIINLPGSKKASQECLEIVLPAIGHAIDHMQGNMHNIRTVHHQLQSQTPATAAAASIDSSLVPSSLSHASVGGDSHSSHHQQEHPHGYRYFEHHHGVSHSHGNHNHHHHHHHHQHDHSESITSSVDENRVARRPRESPFPIISVEEAVKIVMSETNVCDLEMISFTNGLHRVLAEDVFALEPLPPFPASIKDGYAVLAADGDGPRQVIGDSTAGSVPSNEVVSGWCMRISTGAPLPPGADAVVQVEDTLLVKEGDDGKEELEIQILVKPVLGQDIRKVGSDIVEGEKILSAGIKIGPSEVGLLATVGVTKIKVYQLPKVGVMSTGNELVEPESPLQPSKIRDSNRSMLMAALREQNFRPLDLGIAQDTSQSLLIQIKAALEKVDVIVTSGGVSMGEKDLVKDVLITDLGAKLHFARVFMKPGKPTTFATVDYFGKKKLFFGLPGNPVSSIVTCNLYVIPTLRKMSSQSNANFTIIKARLDRDIFLDPRPEYHRCILDWNTEDGIPIAQSTGNQISSRLLSMKSITGMLLLPNKTKDLSTKQKGEIVECMIIGQI